MKINIQIKLAGLWTTLMLLYIYCDIYSFHRTGYINEMMADKIGPFDVSQGILAVFGALMLIPALMLPVNLFMNSKAAKIINIISGILYSIVNIGNLIGETWVYYWIYGITEMVITILIIITAIKIKKKDGEQA